MQLEIPTTEAPTRTAQTDTDALTNGNTPVSVVETEVNVREKLSVSGWALLGTLVTALFFVYWSYLPVYHTDIWGHVSYGRWILQHGSLPVEDPFVDLAVGVEMINNAWLSQVLFGWASRYGGAQGLSDAYAVLCLALFLVSMTTFSLRAKQWGVGFLTACAAWFMVIFRLSIVRPELLGEICFAALLLQITASDRFRERRDNSGTGEGKVYPTWAWATIPLTFAFWTNLHGSYIVGFVVLGAAVIGSLLTATFKHRSLAGVWCDRQLRGDIVIVELSLLATCLNPYGIDMLLQTLLFPSHPNLKSVMEWYPLEMISLEGIPMAISWLTAAFLIRLSRAKFQVRDVVMLIVISVAVCLRVRMIAWYAPIYFFVMTPHIADIFKQLAEFKPVAKLNSALSFMSRPSFHAGIISVFICYLAFAFTPISRHSMGGTPRSEEKIVSHQTPDGVTNYFAEHPQRGLIYAPQWWGDWINWKLDGEVEVFVSTNTIHLVPPEVWQDYMTISRGRAGFEHLLDRYRINTMVVSKDLQPALVKLMDSKKGWSSTFADDVSVIYVRDGFANAVSDSAETAH